MGKLAKIMFGTVLVGMVVGTGVGALIGAISPGFVRWVFGELIGPSVVLDGVALGLANGALYGVIGGSALVIGTAILERRREA